ncbi:SpoIIE family protein phosphatase [Streptomyces sp. NPDC006422]|uniref:SpoIIE family protein phosphatase n=1 Tax=unclassified Streptomyces TaxID=2593676 RepID=UPI0033AAB390
MNRYGFTVGPTDIRESDVFSAPGGLLDLLGVAAVVLDVEGRITLWSPDAERLFGYSAEEALGRSAEDLLVAPEHAPQVREWFRRVLEGEPWAGGFPIRCKNGTVCQAEFRNVPLKDIEGRVYALGIATEQTQLREVETGLALTAPLFYHSPIGLAVFDTDLRYLLMNPALEKFHGKPASECVGLRPADVLTFMDTAPIEARLRRVLETGRPMLDQFTSNITPEDPDPEHEYAWSTSYYQLQDTRGRVIGVAAAVIDDTDRHRAAVEADRARRRLATLADAGVRIGSTLDMERTARDLADIAVTDLADVAAVDVLDVIFTGVDPAVPDTGKGAAFRPLAVAAKPPSDAVHAADPVGEAVVYATDRLVTECVTTGRPVMVPELTADTFRRLGSEPHSSTLARAGAHSYLAVPLTAHGCVLGALSLLRASNPRPFDEEDCAFATELADRAAISIDNGRWYRHERDTALALQRSLLPQRAAERPGLEIATRYRPADDASGIGGDWYDVLALPDGRTALVIGDVMGSGINAAATMGQLRTATRTLAQLDLTPCQVLHHLDRLSAELDGSSFITCSYVICQPATGECRIATAGHLPPVLAHPEGPAETLDMDPGAPLGLGDSVYTARDFTLAPRSRLVLYTDGLVETRSDAIDTRLQVLLELLADERPLEETCDHLLEHLRHPGAPDDIALLVARRRGWS